MTIYITEEGDRYDLDVAQFSDVTEVQTAHDVEEYLYYYRDEYNNEAYEIIAQLTNRISHLAALYDGYTNVANADEIDENWCYLLHSRYLPLDEAIRAFDRAQTVACAEFEF